MKIRGWIGAALCMVALGAGAQEDFTEVEDWATKFDSYARVAITSGSEGGSLLFSCNKEIGACLLFIINPPSCRDLEENNVIATTGKIKKQVKTVCKIIEENGEKRFMRLVSNTDDLSPLLKKGDSLTIAYPSGVSETFSLKGAKTAIEEASLAPLYSLQDGFLYGYERSTKGKNASENAPPEELLMYNYSGKNGDVYQVFTKDGSSTLVRECKRPCEFIKVMIFDYSNRAIKTSRLRMKENTVLHGIMTDAMRGQLMPTIITDDNGTEHSIWFDEQKGMILTPVTQ